MTAPWTAGPNLISPGLQLPDTFQRVLREDWKIFAGLSAAAAVLGSLILAAAAGLGGIIGDPGMTELLSAYSSF